MTPHELPQHLCTAALLLIFELVGLAIASTHEQDENNPTHLRGTVDLHSSNNNSIFDGVAIQDETANDLDESYPLQSESAETLQRSIAIEQQNITDGYVLTSQPLSFQISMSIILGIIALVQLALLSAFIIHRSKRVLEFAQPFYICILIAAGALSTGACYLFLYISNVGCVIREPIIFMSLSLMGATIAARAWRISTLMSNPLMTSSGREHTLEKVPRVESCRQFILMAISALSGCEFNVLSLASGRGSNRSIASDGGRSFRVRITFRQMIRAISFLCIPQIVLQVLIMGVPALRWTRTISYSNNYGVTIGQYECRSSAPGSWPMFVSILFAIFPYGCAYILNLRPKMELEKLPEIINERDQLNWAFAIFARILFITSPIIGMTYYYHAPAIRSYASICLVLGLSLSLSYHIGFAKLASLRSNAVQMRRSAFTTFNSTDGGNVHGRGSAAYAVKMAEMYSKIGRSEETLELIDETLEIWKRGNSGGILGSQDAREEIAHGFTKNDLKNLEPDELEMILRLLIIKGDALMKLHGANGFPMSAEMNINAMKIFEHCPAAKKMRDVSIMFPIYNRVGIQLKGGVIDQDDECSLEMDLAERFCREAQVQSYHFARALGNIAEWYGRIGLLDKAFRYFNVMKAVYMPVDHPKLISAAYAVNRCAVTMAVSSLWYMQKGETDKAIERCDQVITEVLPSFDKKDIIGLYHIFWPTIRVLKWSGLVDKAREFYSQWAPAGIETHFAIGPLHNPMCLLLKICDGSSVEYETSDTDIEMALSFDAPDMTDLNLIVDGWSVKTMAAELCLHLARRLEPGLASRENLIDRGIQMSTLAMKRTTTSDGMIKHILAFEAHKDIDDRLLDLRREDNAVNRTIIYDGNERVRRSLSLSHVPSAEDLPKLATRRNAAVDFAGRFTVKDKASNSNGSGKSIGSGGNKSSTSSKGSGGRKNGKKVTFSGHSNGSNLSTSKYSDHKNISQESMTNGSQHSAGLLLD